MRNLSTGSQVVGRKSTRFCWKWSNYLRHAPERIEVVDVLKACVRVPQAGHSFLGWPPVDKTRERGQFLFFIPHHSTSGNSEFKMQHIPCAVLCQRQLLPILLCKLFLIIQVQVNLKTGRLLIQLPPLKTNTLFINKATVHMYICLMTLTYINIIVVSMHSYVKSTIAQWSLTIT